LKTISSTSPKVVGLTDLGLNLHQIRMTTKMTHNLADKYKKIYQEFDTDQFAWILAKIRNNFHGKNKKKYCTSNGACHEKKR